jgi:FlaA1/EpsC-like NDP-sugar epimerase
MNIKNILWREEHRSLVEISNADINIPTKQKILITWACGSIWTALCNKLSTLNIDYIASDIIENSPLYFDITDPVLTKEILDQYKPHIIINLAWMKYAPLGEIYPEEALSVNTIWVKNILTYMWKDTKFIQASTCKACNPETVYWSTKLISERLVLKNNWIVARFYNVIQTQWNVFSIREQEVKDKQSITVMNKCKRYFISIDEAVWLLLFCLQNDISWIYSINLKKIRRIIDIANYMYPLIEKKIIEPRKWDRLKEKLFSDLRVLQK